MINASQTFKVGDKVKGLYKDAPFVGVIDFYDGGFCIKLSEPCDLGFRVETDGIFIRTHAELSHA